MTKRPAEAGRWDRYGLLACIAIGIVYGLAISTQTVHAVLDFRFYWRATDFGNLYPVDWMDPAYAYVYPPPLAQFVYPFHALPEIIVSTAWTTLCFVCLWYCVRQWTLPLLGLGVVGLAVSNDVLAVGLGQGMLGNINLPIAAAIVAGMRHPGWWFVPILTKMTTGVGVLWFAFRGEWRRFGIAVGVTALVLGVSYVISPGAWAEYVDFSIRNYGGPSSPPIIGPSLPLRVLASILLVWWGARTGRMWTVALAGGICNPGLYGLSQVLVIALGAVTLSRDDLADRLARPRIVTARAMLLGTSNAAAPERP